MGELESDLIKKKMEERESTAPCLQSVSTEFVLIETQLLTPNYNVPAPRKWNTVVY